MNLQGIRKQLAARSVPVEEEICRKAAVIGYEKLFRWRWMATQLNTFIVAADFGGETISVATIEEYLTESFAYAKKNYRGWPRGLQSALGVVTILISESVDDEAARYCRELKSGKKWAGFSVPVVINARTNERFAFEKNPMWGRIYYPYFKKLIEELTR